MENANKIELIYCHLEILLSTISDIHHLLKEEVEEPIDVTSEITLEEPKKTLKKRGRKKKHVEEDVPTPLFCDNHNDHIKSRFQNVI